MNTNLPHVDPEFRERMSGTARRAFIKIGEYWSLTDREQVDLLALDDLAALERFRQISGEPLSAHVLYRISYVLRIFLAVSTLLPDDEIAYGSIRRPNTHDLFGGKSALDVMTTRDLADLEKVRTYLEAQIDPLLGVGFADRRTEG